MADQQPQAPDLEPSLCSLDEIEAVLTQHCGLDIRPAHHLTDVVVNDPIALGSHAA